LESASQKTKFEYFVTSSFFLIFERTKKDTQNQKIVKILCKGKCKNQKLENSEMSPFNNLFLISPNFSILFFEKNTFIIMHCILSENLGQELLCKKF
jgi:hypothetical protein